MKLIFSVFVFLISLHSNAFIELKKKDDKWSLYSKKTGNFTLTDEKTHQIIILFNDSYPTSAPLLNNKNVAKPGPINNPYSKKYQDDLDKYIKSKVFAQAKHKNILSWAIGSQIGIADSEAVNYSNFMFSKDMLLKLDEFLEEKYKIISKLNKRWGTKHKNFFEAIYKYDSKNLKARRDLMKFSRIVIKDWIKLVIKKIRKYDLNHLIASPILAFYPDSKGVWLYKAEKFKHLEFLSMFDLVILEANTKEPEKTMEALKSLQQKISKPLIVFDINCTKLPQALFIVGVVCKNNG
jgi:hypothetical protein